ncbi:hypothetical protein DWUX_1990 [Desulfovibrio diazotrophicus]|nr:hypothetical protein DWUX_1990 [Desulfovibrio diazotrophicus]
MINFFVAAGELLFAQVSFRHPQPFRNFIFLRGRARRAHVRSGQARPNDQSAPPHLTMPAGAGKGKER